MRGLCAAMFGLSLLALAGCGFKPLYSKQRDSDDGSRVYAGVKVDRIAGREGQQLHMELEDALNPGGDMPANPTYRLSARLGINEVAIGVARDATVSRYNLYFDSSYILYRIADGKAVASGAIRHIGSYNNAANAYYSTYISRDDGIRRGVSELAQLYRMRLATYLSEGAPETKAVKTPAPLPSYPNTNWRPDQSGALGTSIPQPVNPRRY